MLIKKIWPGIFDKFNSGKAFKAFLLTNKKNLSFGFPNYF